ncbi:uncharacterized protein J3R85_015100 [Psidium guajava]|nr:uncharacterized protein J3R85_015100 [Psidium guajava]
MAIMSKSTELVTKKKSKRKQELSKNEALTEWTRGTLTRKNTPLSCKWDSCTNRRDKGRHGKRRKRKKKESVSVLTKLCHLREWYLHDRAPLALYISPSSSL